MRSAMNAGGMVLVALGLVATLGLASDCSTSQRSTSSNGVELSDAGAASLEAIFAPLASYAADQKAGSPQVTQVGQQFSGALTDADAKALFGIASSLNAWLQSRSPSVWTPPAGMNTVLSHYGALPYFDKLSAAVAGSPGVGGQSLRLGSGSVRLQGLDVPVTWRCEPPSCRDQSISATAAQLGSSAAISILLDEVFGGLGEFIQTCVIDGECTPADLARAASTVFLEAAGSEAEVALAILTVGYAVIEAGSAFLDASDQCEAQQGTCGDAGRPDSGLDATGTDGGAPPRCDGRCDNTDGSGRACPPYDCPDGQVCGSNGTCAPACPSGQTSCSGTCTNTDLDLDNCGSCGHECPNADPCVGGACVVPDAGVDAGCPSGQDSLTCSGTTSCESPETTWCPASPGGSEGLCTSGSTCTSCNGTNQCLLGGQTCCGAGYCAEGLTCESCNGSPGCLPSGATCCGAGYCAEGLTCETCGGVAACLSAGATCPPGTDAGCPEGQAPLTCNGSGTDSGTNITTLCEPLGSTCCVLVGEYTGDGCTVATPDQTFSCPAGSTCTALGPGSRPVCMLSNGSTSCDAFNTTFGVCPPGSACAPIDFATNPEGEKWECVPSGYMVCDTPAFGPAACGYPDNVASGYICPI